MLQPTMKNFVIVILLALFSGCSSKPYIEKHSEAFAGAGKNEVHIVSHGWHTGFVVPASAIQKRLPQLKERFGDAPYIEFGWGDRGFYQANEITSGLTLKAIFWPTESVIHSVAVPQKPDEYFAGSEVEKLCLNDSEFSSLLDFIGNSFYRDNHGKVLAQKNGIYGDSQFYKGVGDYYLMNTCNKWTAKGLKSAGMDISPTFKLTAGSIMSYLRRYNQAQTNAAERQSPAPLRSADACR